MEIPRRRFQEVGREVVDQKRQLGEARAARAVERRRESRRRYALERLSADWRDVMVCDAELVQRADSVFDQYRGDSIPITFRDGEGLPGAGEDEVERAYADSLLIPLGINDDGAEMFAFLRKWGILRPPAAKRVAIDTPLIDLGGEQRGLFFEVFRFDGYDIGYAAGLSSGPYHEDQLPLGRDVLNRVIHGERLVRPGGDVLSVDDLIRVSTVGTLSQTWAEYYLSELSGSAKDEFRATYSKRVRVSIRRQQQQLADFNGALDAVLRSIAGV